MKKILALMCMILFVSLPIAYSAEIVEDENYDEEETGTSIVVNARSYEPTVLTSNLIEDNNVPVYIYLAGGSIGTILGSSLNLEPVYGGIQIEKVMIKPQNVETAEDYIVGEPKYYKPYKFDVDTLGYVVVTLKQFDPDNFEICSGGEDSECDSGYMCETGVCIPEEVNLSFTADIWFDQAERLYSLSKTALILSEDSSEDEWVEKLDEYGAQYSFFGGRGLIRVKDITENSVDLTVYSNKDLYWPIIGAPRAIEDVTLKKGETSDYIDLGYTDDQVLRNSMFRITFNSVKDPADERANIIVSVNGERMQVSVVEGASLYPGSSWVVQSIGLSRGSSGYQQYDMIIKDASGNTETITSSMTGGLSEEESDVLGKEFTQTRGKQNTIYYETGQKQIAKTAVNNLGALFNTLGISVDTSEVSSSYDTTNAFTLTEGVTLKDVLISVLPSGYYYSVNDRNTIAIKQYNLEDPCGSAEIYSPEWLKDWDSESSTYSTEMKLNMLCSAASQFREIIVNYDNEVMPDTGDNVVWAAKLKLAETYQKIAELDILEEGQKTYCKIKALDYYKELVSEGASIGSSMNINTMISDLQMSVYGEVTTGSASIVDNGENVFVELISVILNDEESKSSTIISKDGVQAEYKVGDSLFTSTFTDEKYGEYNWVVTRIDDNSVQLKKIFSSGTKGSTTETIKVDGSEVIEKYVIKVKSIDSKKEVYLTVTPGSGEALHSVSNFSVHIPIEKRGIQLNPEQIDDRIEMAKNVQEKLEKITTTLEKIVKNWNYACLGVFATVWLKNGIFAGGKNQVRSDVIHGIDGESGWSEYCAASTDYDSYDDCMQSNAQQINNDVENAIQAKEYVNSLGVEDFSSEDWYQDIEKGYDGSLELCKELLGDEVGFSEDSMREYAYMYSLKQNSLSNVMTESLDESFKSYGAETTSVDVQAKQQACKDVKTSVESTANQNLINNGQDEEEQLDIKKQIAAGMYESSYLNSLSQKTGQNVEIPVSKTMPSLNKDYLSVHNIVLVGKVFKGDSSQEFKVYTTNGNVEVKELSYVDYLAILKKEKSSIDSNGDGKAEDANKQQALDKINDDIIGIDGDASKNRVAMGQGERTSTIVAVNGAKFYYAGSTIYVGQAAYSSGSLNENYDTSAKLEVYSSGEYKGLPYCLPYDEGYFIKFLSYTNNNEVDQIQFWNVGSDGLLCTNDDVLVQHESELMYVNANPSYNKLVLFANKYVKMTFRENEVIEINGNKFIVSYGRSRAEAQSSEGSCYDVMDPNDCRLLFNTCDPVLCPPSRFNLGGRWNVDSVIDSGLVGSLVLGQGNGDAVPFCLSGVLSSLKYYNSMLDKYVECLESAKYEGETVGVCDTLRSLYWCEIATKEVAAIVDANGGLLDFIAQKVYNRKDNEGGEYLNFKSNMDNMQDSISYFTTDYGSTMFAAFQGRSTEEVGMTICKQAIYGQAPWFGDLLDQVTTPEDPNQFYASLKITPYAPSQGLASYSTYYHIYAGNNENIPNVVYQVYLKNSLTNEEYYTTEACKGVSGSIELTDSVDYTVDCIAPEGLDTVCVVLNGEENCGFGSVTTSFSAEFVKDSVIADEAMRNITTEEQCYPTASTASPTVSSLASLGTTDSLILPYTYGQLSTGIQRVCALDNPGLGQSNSGGWVAVGSCGEDNEGRSLGTCWLNTDSVNLIDTNNNDDVNAYWEESDYANRILESGVEALSEEQAQEVYTNYVTQMKKNVCSDHKNYASLFQELYERSSSYSYSAASQYRIGEIFFKIGSGEVCGLEGRTEISFEATIDGDEIKEENEIITGSGTEPFIVVFSGLQDGDEIADDGDFNVACSYVLNGKVACSANIKLNSDERKEIEFSIRRVEGGDYSKTFTFVGKNVATPLTTSATTLCEDACGSWPATCTEDKCLAASQGCYFLSSLVNDNCFACSDLVGTGNQICAKFKTEKTCENDICYGEAFDGYGKCAWDGSQCLYEELSSVSTTPDIKKYSDLYSYYGTDQTKIENDYLVAIDFLDFSLLVNKDAENAFKQASENIKINCAGDELFVRNYGYSKEEFLGSAGGTYVYRCKSSTGGTVPNCDLSPHAYGVAIDVRPDLNPVDQKRSTEECEDNNMPECIIKSFEDAGFFWGGDWSTYCDPMHFEYLSGNAR